MEFDYIDVEYSYDYVRIYDENWNLKWQYTGTGTNIVSDWIFGAKLYINLYSDYSVVKNGFKVTVIDCMYIDKDTNYEISILFVEKYDLQKNLKWNAGALSTHGYFEQLGYKEIQYEKDGQVAGLDFDDADSGDYVVFGGHGNKGVVGFKPWGGYASYEEQFCSASMASDEYEIGKHDFEWYFLFACSVLNDNDCLVKQWIENGAHGVCGFWKDTKGSDACMGNVMHGVIEESKDGTPIVKAWIKECIKEGMPYPAYFCYSSCVSDHFLGTGTVRGGSLGSSVTPYHDPYAGK